MEETRALLEQPEVDGVLYKDYAPYNKQKGAIYWHAGKPCVSYRFLLWEPRPDRSPEGVARAVASAARRGRHGSRQLCSRERPRLVIPGQRRAPGGRRAHHRVASAGNTRRDGDPVGRYAQDAVRQGRGRSARPT